MNKKSYDEIYEDAINAILSLQSKPLETIDDITNAFIEEYFRENKRFHETKEINNYIDFLTEKLIRLRAYNETLEQKISEGKNHWVNEESKKKVLDFLNLIDEVVSDSNQISNITDDMRQEKNRLMEILKNNGLI
jgi:hypothetical protein